MKYVYQLLALLIYCSQVTIIHAQESSPNYFWSNHISTLSEWEPRYFTEPSTFDPKKFRFIYHTVSGWNWPELPKDSHTYQIALDPHYIVRNPKISATVIDETHRFVFRKGVGLILEVPTSNIIFTAHLDVGSPWESGLTYENIYPEMSTFLKRKKLKLLSPQEVLNRTDSRYLWNEIGIFGKEPTYGNEVDVKALVITAKSLGCETDKERQIQDEPWIKFRYILWDCGFDGEWIDRMMDLKSKYIILLMNL